MRNYEITFIVDPVLSGDEIKSTASAYKDMCASNDCKITNVEEMGLRQLAYPIKKRNSGVYYTIEFQSETGQFIPQMELALRRDSRVIRFLTVALDKFGVQYNADKRDGKIGKVKKVVKPEPDSKRSSGRPAAKKPARPPVAPAPAPVAEKPAPSATQEEE